ncbi:MAG: amidase, partial [Chloroflexi bacterium]|nr:amidase [Chloroflexota bacterium]
GSRSWAGHVPSYDATAVHRLKEAGAVILGKTHTTEFACYDPPPTRNPWNTAHTPGGSSSGSGAAVAVGMCLAALGTQTGGSTLRPAAYNGVVGLKPQLGRVSTFGLVPVSWAFDHVGILARTVEDAAIVLQAIAGPDPQDPYTFDEPAPDYRASVESQRKPPSIGLVRDYFFERASDEMRQHTEAVVERLRRAGAVVRDITLPPSFHSVPDAHMTLLFADCAAYHEEMFAARKELYGPGIRSMIEKGLTIPATAYARALHVRAQACADMASVVREVDALLTPGATGPAPKGLTSTGDAVMQMPWSHVGYPAVSLPSGRSREGLPLAVQLVGQPRGETRLFAVARWCESALDVRLQPPLESLH